MFVQDRETNYFKKNTKNLKVLSLLIYNSITLELSVFKLAFWYFIFEIIFMKLCTFKRGRLIPLISPLAAPVALLL